MYLPPMLWATKIWLKENFNLGENLSSNPTLMYHSKFTIFDFFFIKIDIIEVRFNFQRTHCKKCWAIGIEKIWPLMCYLSNLFAISENYKEENL